MLWTQISLALFLLLSCHLFYAISRWCKLDCEAFLYVSLSVSIFGTYGSFDKCFRDSDAFEEWLRLSTQIVIQIRLLLLWLLFHALVVCSYVMFVMHLDIAWRLHIWSVLASCARVFQAKLVFRSIQTLFTQGSFCCQRLFALILLLLKQLLWQNVWAVEWVLLSVNEGLWLWWQAEIGAGCAVLRQLVTVDHVLRLRHQIKWLRLQHRCLQRWNRVLPFICAKCFANLWS